jgi:hypothetical protein
MTAPNDPFLDPRCTEQKRCSSGKKRLYTLKSVVLINASVPILLLSEPYGDIVTTNAVWTKRRTRCLRGVNYSKTWTS